MSEYPNYNISTSLKFSFSAAIIFYCVYFSFSTLAAEQVHKNQPPNVIFILIDELRYDEVTQGERQVFVNIPNIDALANKGTSFQNFYSVSTICSPNRASLLTGQYPAIHGVVDNTDRSQLSRQLPTFARALHKSGYETAFVGKWHMGNDPTPRPGFDFWAAIPGQGQLWNPEIWKDNQLRTIKGYVTDVLTNEALSFLRQPRNKPFMLYLSHKAIHPDAKQNQDSSVDLSFGMRYEAATRHRGLYKDNPVRVLPNVHSFEVDPPGKTVLSRAFVRKRSKENIAKWGSMLELDSRAETVRNRAEMLLSIDEGIGKIIEEIRHQGRLDNTIIIFTSDNGTSVGEHGITIERRLPYEGIIHLPLIVYYNGWQPIGGVSRNELVLNIDIAPTILEAAGIKPGATVQGDSLRPLLEGTKTEWRQSFLVEHRPDERPFSWVADMSYLMLRQNNLKYIHWLRYPDESELYDLSRDPYEQKNVMQNPDYKQMIPSLREEIRRLVLKARGL